MDTVRTASDKHALLKTRREEERRLGEQIDLLVAKAAEPTPGCGICSVWRRLTRTQKRVVATAIQEEAVLTGSSQVAKGATSTQNRLFGMKKQSANEKLGQAAEALKSRLLQMESRAASEREEAKVAMRAGQKASAMRMLKRAKMTDKQVESAQQSLLAIEQQVDLMAQAAMQKEIASALASSSKGFKANKKLVKSAEEAVDDAQDARDVADDLSNALSELGGHDNGDDDELLQELKSMMDDGPPDSSDAVEISLSDDGEEARREQEIANLETRISRWEEAEEVRQKLPGVPKANAKKEEKEGLLSSQ